MSEPMTTRQRVILAVGMALIMTVGATVYILVARSRETAVAASPGVSIAAGPRIAFVSTAAGSKGRLATVAAAAPAGPRLVSPVSCNRVYAAAGVGICLRQDGALATYQMAALDQALHVTQTLPLVGLPNRARVSPDGRMLAWTVFVTGDSYNGGVFSTRAGIEDTFTGDIIDMEDFAVTLNGRPYRAVDENFWGVTFARDSNTFYATMSTRGRPYLVRGDIALRTVTAVRPGVECPSLSPDGTRIAFKQAIGGNPKNGWHLAVLDLVTGGVTVLAETRSVDDQAAWLSDAEIGYGLPHGTGGSDVWAVPADGSGRPRLLIPDAMSPAAL
jgi:hypothetical protein